MELHDINVILTFYLVSAVLATYIFFGAIYRLFFSPIAKFPGPRLAALSFW